MSDVRLLDEETIKGLIDPRGALREVRSAFAMLAQGRATLPSIMTLRFDTVSGEAHVKGAYLHEARYWSIKAATSFVENATRGLAPGGGLSVVFSAETGRLAALLLDNGYLTDLRTGAAGALAAELLSNRDATQALIVGAGVQARYQLRALLGVREPAVIVCWARRASQAGLFAREMSRELAREVVASDDLEGAARASSIIVTTTSSHAPVVEADWIRPGTHVTAVGSDFPEKQELDVGVFAIADVIACDEVELASRNGELHHALEAGTCERMQVTTLGELELGWRSGRQTAGDITICDLVGVGVQDAAVANLVVAQATRTQVGRTVEV